MAEHASKIEPVADQVADLERSFIHALHEFEQAPVLILTHNDADGLSAGVVLLKALEQVRIGTKPCLNDHLEQEI